MKPSRTSPDGPRRILLVGGNGFIGRALTDCFLARGAGVSWLVRKNAAAPSGVKVFSETGSRDGPWKKESFTDLVILTNTPLNKSFPEAALDIFETHVAFPLRLLDWARTAKIQHVVCFSSGSVYAATKLPGTGILPGPQPDFFVLAKSALEMLAQRYQGYFHTHIIRLFRPYGPSPGRSMINQVLENVLAGKKVSVPAPDGPEIQPVHLADVAAITWGLLNIPQSTVIDLAGNERLTLGELGRRFAKLAGIDFPVETTSQPLEHDQRVQGTGIRELDSLVATPLNGGLQSLLTFYKQRPLENPRHQ